ncbi:DUF3152 domain-containing protein [Nocardioides sp. cx-169]|uniref:DUF3152 domain-containing protein n=1 Tax=Nocardioides sp. cx-169 TaxID=2899080 RepID=UPI001E371A31|nr:DUF3152 domain-containing protein [Nocardioides sp. cx-169]MCD4533993.1 DUF3152 domain-containing protein [Nocardioides sp. cx-169]
MLLRAALLSVVTTLGLLVPVAAHADPVVNATPPEVVGEAVVGTVVTSTPGTWVPEDVSAAYRWLRDDRLIPGAAARSYRIRPEDLRHRLTVRVVATDADGHSEVATSQPTAPVARGRLVSRRPPAVVGTQRFTRTVEASRGHWSSEPGRTTYQWLRGGRPIPGATARRYTYAPEDVGRHVRVQVTVRAVGYHPAAALSPRTRPVGHRVDVRRTVTYHVETRGAITTSLRDFRRLAQETYEDPRGWRGKGVRFLPVARGGSFTLVLAEASRVPAFSPVCSSQWSCRVGRYVVINQLRWKHASPAWNRAHGPLRGYRHMVVNHETGHWLGKGHAGCPGRGRPAPVMMQQSKGLDGCRFNPWPTAGELR